MHTPISPTSHHHPCTAIEKNATPTPFLVWLPRDSSPSVPFSSDEVALLQPHNAVLQPRTSCYDRWRTEIIAALYIFIKKHTQLLYNFHNHCYTNYLTTN